MKDWVILCPGVSLREDLIRHSSLAGKAVIAVNGAIAVSPGDADFWAVQDVEVFRTAFELLGGEALASLQFPTTIWTHSNFVHTAWNSDPAWHSGLTDCLDGFRFRIHKTILTDGAFAGMHWDYWREYTFFTALALAIHSGAENVSVLGCDLSEGYFEDSFKNERTQHNEGRWIREAAILRTFILPILERMRVKVEGIEAYADRF